MKFTETNIAADVEILAADDFVAIPFNATADLKAGAVAEVDGRKGVVLYDVEKDGNAALVVAGVIDGKKAKAHSGVDLSTESLPDSIVVRNNTGVNA